MIIISKLLNFIYQVCRSVLKEMFFFRSEGWSEYCGKS